MTEEARKCVEALRYVERTLIRNGGIAEENMAKGVARAIDLIESMSAQLDQVTRERDAAVEQLKEADANKLFWCDHCKYEGTCIVSPCNSCVNQSNWQWCGVEVEG